MLYDREEFDTKLDKLGEEKAIREHEDNKLRCVCVCVCVKEDFKRF